MKLMTHSASEKVEMSGVYLFLPLYTIMALTGTVFPSFYLSKNGG